MLDSAQLAEWMAYYRPEQQPLTVADRMMFNAWIQEGTDGLDR